MPTTVWARHKKRYTWLAVSTFPQAQQVLTLRGLVTYYVLFFIHLESRRVAIAGITVHPNEAWMKQMARNVTMEDCGDRLDPPRMPRSHRRLR
jgi:hypothetical protein